MSTGRMLSKSINRTRLYLSGQPGVSRVGSRYHTQIERLVRIHGEVKKRPVRLGDMGATNVFRDADDLDPQHTGATRAIQEPFAERILTVPVSPCHGFADYRYRAAMIHFRNSK